MPSTHFTGATGRAAPLTDDETLRARARHHIEQGPVTAGYRGDRQVLLDLLARALATELTCMLRYKQHALTAQGLNAESVSAEFDKHAQQAQAHAYAVAARIVQLGGLPTLNPWHIAARSHVEYVECATLKDMIRENLVAERIAIESYRETIDYIGADDPTTRRQLEEILAVEEQHADELTSLMGRYA
ncbi:MAG: bacterioferritin [Paludibacterium sp.]|uniref:ferritin-like domain-containing protein n=1 Tax=Paludibacterium sp. TaxID=1917523 RepID=UPI0025DB7797|nr:ferritin-like domain-containing protein [Paludibacterium sp.]MBV8047602.1 bacterioferritin [Paludibacterium sp.]